MDEASSDGHVIITGNNSLDSIQCGPLGEAGGVGAYHHRHYLSSWSTLRNTHSCIAECRSWSAVRFTAFLVASPSCSELALLFRPAFRCSEEGGVLDHLRLPHDLCVRGSASRGGEEKSGGGVAGAAEEPVEAKGEGGRGCVLFGSFSYTEGL